VSPRLRPVEDPAPEVAELLAQMPQRDGRPLNVFATMAHHPRLLKRLNVFGGLFLAHGKLPYRDREIVILRTAWRAGSEYEFGQHTLLGRDAGLTEDEIAALAGGGDGLPSADALLVGMVDQLADRARVDEATWTRLVEAYGEAGAVEAVMLSGFYRMLAGFISSAEIERESGVPGWPLV
jgi:4-carboxymuconolactone decarboxylase